MKEEKENEYEKNFEYWLQELLELDLILAYTHQPKTFELYPPLEVPYLEKLKTKDKPKFFNILRDIKYTADFSFIVNKNKNLAHLIGHLNKDFLYSDPREFLFYTTQVTRSGHPIVIVDIKPSSQATRFSSALGSSREFPVKQRILYDKQGIFVNKVVPYGSKDCLFGKTFTPENFYFTDKRTKIRSVPKDKDKKPLYVPILINSWKLIHEH
jgi:hypothetical protein